MFHSPDHGARFHMGKRVSARILAWATQALMLVNRVFSQSEERM